MSNAPTIKLVTNEDWTIWFKALKTKAKNQDLWEYLDPTKPHKPLLISTAPTPPNIKDFRKRSSAITRSAVSNTNTPSSATQDTIVADPTEMDEDYRAREDDDAAILAQDVADLSEKGLRVYNALWTNYEHLSKRHEALKEKKALAAIRLAISEHPEPTKRPCVTHGAFFTAEGVEEEADSDKDTPRKEHKRKQPPKKKKRRESGDRPAECPACQRSHPLDKCFHVFPHLRPANFKISQRTTDLVRQRIDDNADGVADKIKKIKMEKSA
ncbi:hypothetical protein FOXYS1_6935 [Fusarium oxysporum]|uniref:Uncharacterized protein n=1 Tax=Fusarium oxysporum TaxID=5507 RepID=A0A8H5ABR6_FUSOX|nr:hypothetical protein FOXYS1_6935 [Fusarium oxysporum]